MGGLRCQKSHMISKHSNMVTLNIEISSAARKCRRPPSFAHACPGAQRKVQVAKVDAPRRSAAPQACRNNPATPDAHWAGGESWWSWRMRACAQPCRACCAESKMHTHAGRLLCHRPGAACHAAAKRRPATIGFEQGPNLLSNQFSVF